MPDRIKQPNPETYANPAVFSSDHIFVPSPHVLRNEMRIWRDRQRLAVHRREAGMRLLSYAVIEKLYDSGRGQLRAQAMRREPKTIDRPFLHRWSMDTAGTLATAALVRHITFENRTIDLNSNEADIGIHFSSVHPSNNRVFVHRRKLASNLLIEPPLPAHCWYEFDDVVTEAESPATDIDTYGINYLDAHDHAFDFAKYVSFTPFLKQEVWSAGNETSKD